NVFSAHSQAEMGIMAIYTAAKRFFAFSNSHALRHATPRHTASIEYGRVKPALSTLTHDFLSKKSFCCRIYRHYSHFCLRMR
ncbi:hypothetical protein ACUODF_27405, partial [Escherichia coli]